MSAENKAKLFYVLCRQLSKLSLTSVEGEIAESLPVYDAERLSGVIKEDVQLEITVLEERLATMKPNMAAIEEYRKKVGDCPAPPPSPFCYLSLVLLQMAGHWAIKMLTT